MIKPAARFVKLSESFAGKFDLLLPDLGGLIGRQFLFRQLLLEFEATFRQSHICLSTLSK